MALPDF